MFTLNRIFSLETSKGMRKHYLSGIICCCNDLVNDFTMASKPYMSWVCCWFSSFLLEIFRWVLRFSQHNEYAWNKYPDVHSAYAIQKSRYKRFVAKLCCIFTPEYDQWIAPLFTNPFSYRVPISWASVQSARVKYYRWHIHGQIQSWPLPRLKK